MTAGRSRTGSTHGVAKSACNIHGLPVVARLTYVYTVPQWHTYVDRVSIAL